jgi:hypothetical protein
MKNQLQMSSRNWRTRSAVSVVLFLVTFGSYPSTALAQVATGTPPFGSFSGGPDIVNNANLNVHFSISIEAKPGKGSPLNPAFLSYNPPTIGPLSSTTASRGLPFIYSLNYDSLIWSQSGGAWVPAPNWGWRAITEATTGYATAPAIQRQCRDVESGQYFTYTDWGPWSYNDPQGTSHFFNSKRPILAVWTGMR